MFSNNSKNKRITKRKPPPRPKQWEKKVSRALNTMIHTVKNLIESGRAEPDLSAKALANEGTQKIKEKLEEEDVLTTWPVKRSLEKLAGIAVKEKQKIAKKHKKLSRDYGWLEN